MALFSDNPDLRPRRTGLRNLVDMIAAPRDAFAALRDAPTWGWAFVVTTALVWLSVALIEPAFHHVLAPILREKMQRIPHLLPSQYPSFARFALRVVLHVVVAAVPFALLLRCFEVAAMMWLIAKATHADASFKRLWALTVNVTVVYAIGDLVDGILIRVRPLDAISNLSAFERTSLSLAAFAGTTNLKLAAALGTISPFSVWALVLLGVGLPVVARMDRVPVIVTISLIAVLEAALASFGAHSPP